MRKSRLIEESRDKSEEVILGLSQLYADLRKRDSNVTQVRNIEASAALASGGYESPRNDAQSNPVAIECSPRVEHPETRPENGDAERDSLERVHRPNETKLSDR
jgi:hypothetical protein